MKYYILKTLGYFVKTIFIKYYTREKGESNRVSPTGQQKAGGDEREL